MKNSTRGQVDPFIVMDVMEAARAAEAAGRHIIHMEVGQPSTGAPAAAIASLRDEMSRDALGYTVGLGLPELRVRIARHYAEWYGVTLDPARVVITSGASGAFILAFTALFDAGQRVGLGVPCYPSYRQILRALDLTPVDIRTRMEHRLQPVPAQITADLDGLIVASPANPTGTMLDRDAMAALAAACDAAGVSLISDEIYHGLSYGTRAVSALEVTDEVYVINSFSKYFSMTGWRVGWMVVPQDHVRIVERLAQNLFICAPHAAQRLALAAMDCTEELEANVAVYAANRDVLMQGLAQAGFATLAPPDGAFYVYADVSAYTDDARAFAAEILAEAGVAVTPGLDFDPTEGQGWLRFSYARSTEDVTEGVARLVRFMAGRQKMRALA
ncbi:pyridoxal phosphate-dependent aminotransferase [Flavimaricola marinus]|uniref:Aminotransferase n=1 Tax=Flavimaricola marinus TaxID=1819565 RepID=A0A238LDZ1_9RHOB|nr:aminotransferase class I/II-fold pyridoxal phosphate-dependent enzyme [Flavimaricola marinus]SMY07899.1 Aspartate aminotransferase [Flavimaricola marinus]